MQKHIVIFSHGFGVQSDARGMFTDIAAALSPATEKVLFDYNRWDEDSRTLASGTMDEWVEKLRKVITETRANNPDAVVDLICHSQGCLVAGLAKPEGLRKIILLGPPAELTAERMIETFVKLSGVRMKVDETSRLPRRDGSSTLVPPEYWQSIRQLEGREIELYNALAKKSKVVVINAGADEVVDNPPADQLDSSIKQITIKDANHNFTDSVRPELLKAVHKEMERVPIVNEQDEVIAHKFRDEVTDDEIYRVAALWVTNPKGDILLAQRSLHKSHNPGKWGPAVAGTVEAGDSYEDTIIREAAEEIGLYNFVPKDGIKRRTSDPYNYFSTTFSAVLDKPAEEFEIEYPDVNQVRWFTREELERELGDRPDDYLIGVSWRLREL